MDKEPKENESAYQGTYTAGELVTIDKGQFAVERTTKGIDMKHVKQSEKCSIM